MMMYWYGHGMSGWAWFWMTAGNLLFWAALITAVVLLFRAVLRPGTHVGGHPGWSAQPPSGSPGAEQILAERYARGEIDEEEYRRRLDILRGSSPGPAGK
ncbi:SHOCT domain-containing protein [Streptomyces sp. NPDC058457]|uniref:SHOCT domain-containing protein n=1 Tax=Streptomyces sp. NPDC058457 TaxID=3346507 RepID=UPI00366994AD